MVPRCLRAWGVSLATLLLPGGLVTCVHGDVAYTASDSAAGELLHEGRQLEAHSAVTETTTSMVMPTVKVNAEPITLTLMIPFQEKIFFDIVRFRQIFLDGMAETLAIDKSRLWIVRLRETSNKQWPQQETTTTTYDPNAEKVEEVPEMKVEGRAVVDFWILDPPLGINGETPVHWASEKANRLDALLKAEARGPWKGGLLEYVQGGVMVKHQKMEVYVPEGQFDGSYDPMVSPALDTYVEPNSCICSAEPFGATQTTAGCAEHFGLAPGFEPSGTAWCMVAVECNGAVDAYGGYYVVCDRKDDPNAGNRGVMRASEAGRGSGLPPLAVVSAWVAVLLSVSRRS